MTTVPAPWSTHDPTANQRPGIGSRDAASANGGTGPRAGSLSTSKCVQEWDTGDANCEEMKTLSPHPGLNTNIGRWGGTSGGCSVLPDQGTGLLPNYIMGAWVPSAWVTGRGGGPTSAVLRPPIGGGLGMPTNGRRGEILCGGSDRVSDRGGIRSAAC